MDISTPEPDQSISDTVDHHIKIAKNTVSSKSAISSSTVDLPSLIPPLFDNAMSHDDELNPPDPPAFFDDVSHDMSHDVLSPNPPLNVSLSHDASHDIPCEDLELLFLRLTAIRSMLSKQSDPNLDDTNIDIDANSSDHNVVSTTCIDTTASEYHQYADSNTDIDTTTDCHADIDTTVDSKVESHHTDTDIVNVPSSKDSQLAVKLVKDLEVTNVADPHIDSTADTVVPESLSNLVNSETKANTDTKSEVNTDIETEVNTDIKAKFNADTSTDPDVQTDINVDSDTVVHIDTKPAADTDRESTEVAGKVDNDTTDVDANDVNTSIPGVKPTDPAPIASTDSSQPVTSSSPPCPSTSVSVVAMGTESIAMDTNSVAMDTGLSDSTVKPAELSSVKVFTEYNN